MTDEQFQADTKAKEAARLESIKVALLEIEKKILPVIKKWIETRSLYHVTPEDQIEGKRIWDNYLFPGGVKASIGCQDCAKEIFTTILAFYERHTNRLARAEEQGLRSDPIITPEQIDAQRAASGIGKGAKTMPATNANNMDIKPKPNEHKPPHGKGGNNKRKNLL